MSAYGGRHRRPVRRRALIGLVCVLGLCAGLVPATAELPATATFEAANPTVISPNGDGYDDTTELGFCVSTNAVVDVTVTTAAHVPVRSLAVDDHVDDGCSYDVEWDGTDDSGKKVGNGNYLAVLSAAFDHGGSADDSEQLVVDDRVPGVLTLPADGASLDNPAAFRFTPTAGFQELESVDFQLQNRDGDRTCDGAGTSNGAAWTASIDLDDCGVGARTARAVARWTDDYGDDHYWQSPAVAVTMPAAPPKIVFTSPSQSFSPDADGNDDALEIDYCPVGTSDAAGVRVRGSVVDSKGRMVTQLVDDVEQTVEYCASYYGNATTLTWDGTDAQGDPVADARYRLVFTATSPGGDKTTELPVAVDRRPPGTITAPKSGASLTDPASLAFTPRADAQVDDVDFGIADADGDESCSAYSGTAESDGVFRAALSFDGCGRGARQVVAHVSWTDSFDTGHYWSSPGVAVVLPHSAPTVTFETTPAAVTPDGDGDSDTLEIRYCVGTDEDPSSTLHTNTTVENATGQVVRRLSSEQITAADGCAPRSLTWDGRDDNGAILPDGPYAVVVTATSADQLTGRARLDTAVAAGTRGTISAPAEGDTVSGPMTVRFAPAPNVDVTSVAFDVRAGDGEVVCSADAQADTHADWTATPEYARCGLGARTIVANVVWRDDFGVEHAWTSPATDVRLTSSGPAIAFLSSPRAFGTQHDSTLILDYCPVADLNTGPLHVVMDVEAANGDVVRRILDKRVNPREYCVSGYGQSQSVQWDGTGEDDAPVPAGDYTVHATVSDDSDRASSATLATAVDRRNPGVLVAPAAGSVLAATTAVQFTANPGLRSLDVSFSARNGQDGCAFVAGTRDADGTTWRGDLHTADCHGRTVVSAYVSWVDKFGEYHGDDSSVVTGTGAVTVSVAPAFVNYYYSRGDVPYSASYCLFSATGRADVTTRIRDAAGVVVRSSTRPDVPSDADPGVYSYCQSTEWDGKNDSGDFVPGGDYTLELMATAGSTSVTTSTMPIHVVADVPLTITSPVAGLRAAGAVRVSLRVANGINPTSVSAVAGGCAVDLTPDGPHMYSGSVDPSRTCYNASNYYEAREADAYLTWTDPEGNFHYMSAGPVTYVRPGAPTATVSLPTQVFSPEGDGQDDTLAIYPCAVDALDGGPLSVSTLVTTADGTVVRTFPSRQVLPVAYCYGSYYGGPPAAVDVWDGTDGDGRSAPDGNYRVAVTVTDRDGLIGISSRDIQVDRTPVGTVTEPAADASVAGTVEFGFLPTPGVQVSYVSFELSTNDTSGCSSQGVTSADLDGVWRTAIDTVGEQCGYGPRTVRARVSWRDHFGGYHVTYTSPTSVTLTNPATAPVASVSVYPPVFSPNGDGQEDSTGSYACVSGAAARGPKVHVVLDVRDDAGSRVRLLRDSDEAPNRCLYLSWDGQDDAGHPAPDGSYRATFTATDPAGLTSTATSSLIVVDRRLPGAVTAPEPDAVLAGAQRLVFTPTAGFDIADVVFSLTAPNGVTTCSFSASRDASTRTWVAVSDTSSCGAGSRTVVASVQWTDSGNRSHFYTSSPVSVRLAAGPPVVEVERSTPQVFSPNGDGQEDSTYGTYCAQGSETDGQQHVVVQVRSAQGKVVATLRDAMQDPQPLCSPTYGYSDYFEWDGRTSSGAPAPAGDYTVVVTASAAGLTATQSVPVTVDRRRPGTLTTPVANATLLGVADVVFEPTAGVSIDAVQGQVSHDSAGRQFDLTQSGSTGNWTASFAVGDLPAGPATFELQVISTDAVGDQHLYRLTRTVVLDTVNVPLSVRAYGSQGAAPLASSLELTTSDGQAGTVVVTVDWGDGSAPTTTSIDSPYDSVNVGHTYSSPGNYTANASAANKRGGVSAKQTVPIRVTTPSSEPPTPNQPPAVLVSTAPGSGSAPVTTTTTLSATDPDGDTLRYTVDYGDGSDRAVGVLGSDPLALTHTFGTGGVYTISTLISDGKISVARFSSVSVADDEPLVAVAGDDRVGVTGAPVHFDASGSRPALAIGKYHWTFGDGTSADGVAVDHTYSDAGTYSAQLTVTSGAETAQDVARIQVFPPASNGTGLAITVTDTAAAPLQGATVTVTQADGKRISALTDARGVGTLRGLPDSNYSVAAYVSGYLPRQLTATVDNGSGSATIALSPGQLLAADVQTDRLDPDQAAAAGIDVSKPQNRNVVQFSLHLAFNGSGFQASGYTSSGGGFPVCPDIRGVQDYSCDRRGVSFYSEGYRFVLTSTTVENQPQLVWLVLPGKASWLKELFSVKMLVTNLADPSFSVDQGTAQLSLPPGLTLAPMEGAPQSLLMPVPAIVGGSSQAATWYVRGDAEGDYDLRARYAGILQPVGTPVSIDAGTKSPLHVWGTTAMQLTVDADETATAGHPYHVTVGLKNVADVPVYNVDLAMTAAGKAGFIYQPRARLETTQATVAPGETLELPLILVPLESGNLQLGESFVATSAGVTSAPPSYTSHPSPTSQPSLTATPLDHKVGLTWDTVPGATNYEIYSIANPSEDFAADPLPARQLGTVGGVARAVVTDQTPGVKRYYAVSSVIGGRNTMVHALVSDAANQTVETPRVSLDLGGVGQYDHVCDVTRISGAVANAHDDFGLASYTVTVDGKPVQYLATKDGKQVPVDPKPASGLDLQTDGFDIVFPSKEKTLDVTIAATNLAGDTRRVVETLDRTCLSTDIVVLAAGLTSSLSDSASAPISDPSAWCDSDGKVQSGRDKWNDTWATNACPGEPNYGRADNPLGNMLGYLESKGFDPGKTRVSPARTVLEFSYNGAVVDCSNGRPTFRPLDYSASDTVDELVELAAHTTVEADSYLDSLKAYRSCWRQFMGTSPRFTLIGHSEGGYESLAMAHLADAAGDRDLISNVVTVDGAIKPFTLGAEIAAGHCFFDNELLAGLADNVVRNVIDSVTKKLIYPAAAVESLAVDNEIKDLQNHGINVVTVTNKYDTCLQVGATTSGQALVNKVFAVDVHQAGMVQHSALLQAHRSPVSSSGFPLAQLLSSQFFPQYSLSVPVTRAVANKRVLRVAAQRTLSRNVAAATGSIGGRVVRSGGTTPVAGAEVVAVSDGDDVSTTTAADGTFTFGDLPDGSYRLSVTPTDAGDGQSWFGGADRASATPVVVAGAPSAVGDVPAGRVSSLTVTVVDPSDRPVAEGIVQAVDGSGAVVAQTTTGTDGQAVLSVPAGPVTVRVGARRFRQYSHDLVVGGATAERAQLVPTSQISAKLTDTTGQPQPGVLALVHDDHDQIVGVGITDETGTAVVQDQPVGRYQVSFAQPVRAATAVVPIAVPVVLTSQTDVASVAVVNTPTPIFTDGNPPATVQRGSTYSYDFGAVGDPSPTLTVTDGQLPPGLTLDTDGRLSGTPTAGGKYTFTVGARNTAGSASVGPFTITVTEPATITLAAAPGQPIAVAGSRSADVTWTPPNDTGGGALAGYVVQYSSDGGSTWHDFARSGVAAAQRVTGLLDGTNYVFRVAAVTAAGTGVFSPVSTAVTPRTGTTLTAVAPRTVPFGRQLTVVASYRAGAEQRPIDGATLTLYRRVATTQPWVYSGAATTNAAGTAALAQRASISVEWQWRYSGAADGGPITSVPVPTTVTQLVATVRVDHKAVKQGAKVRVYGTVLPSTSGTQVRLQQLVRKVWKTVSFAARTKRQRLPNGKTAIGFVIVVKTKAKGRFTFRVLAPAARGLGAGVSAPSSIKVR